MGGTAGTVLGGQGGVADAGAKPRDAGAVNGSGGASGSGGGIGTSLDAGADPNRPIYAYAAAVENTSTDCQVSALADGSKLTTKVSKLPDPFARIDGSRMSKRSDWHCRRQEILEQSKKYIYGARPEPEVVSGTVAKDKISVHVKTLGKKIDFTAQVVLPSKGQAPYPAMISVGAKGGMGGLTLGESRMLDEGVAVIY
jgi:hypothetical protein